MTTTGTSNQKRVRLKTTELPKPVYAAAGAGDLAYQQLRKLPEVAARTIRTASETADELRQRLAAQEETVSIRVRASAERGRSRMRETALAAQQRAVASYHNLVAHGERVVADRAGAGPDEPAQVEVIVGPVQSHDQANGASADAGQSRPTGA
ncbi:hypothetical protein JQS43_24005 [Natronosporangium hydrolyticum]|uniref:Uncharacterized protein n=1 Tax=Natronosporangium hydrolyticum TaxID=2811111 RepID=A0A895YKX7_9ACTN|nr:hypothetical protein [Natronosporangium hydrolyticum]QSB14508.1 hypothetical protein JQS43_24005 [Natronosporangium hydrolyticum]